VVEKDGLTFRKYQEGTDETVAYADEQDVRNWRIDRIGDVGLRKLLLELVKLGRTADGFKKFIRDGTEPPDVLEGVASGSFGLRFDHKQIYVLLGLISEVKEVAEVYLDATITGNNIEEVRVRLAKELGDVEWYTARMAREFGMELEAVAAKNLEKLRSRKERGKIGGSGDDR
jgi:NTP pyrophosphatase (non-canonical NTP hydrolase)